MFDAFDPDTPCSIEDAVRYLRGLTHLLAQDPKSADDLIEESLTGLLASDAGFDLDTVDLRTLFQPLRGSLGTLAPSRRDTGARPTDLLPYILREALLLHRSAGMSLTAISALLDEPVGLIRERIKDAERMICNRCPALGSGPIAA